MAVRSNMHLDDMVIEVSEVNSEVRSDLRGLQVASEAIKRRILKIQNMIGRIG